MKLKAVPSLNSPFAKAFASIKDASERTADKAKLCSTGRLADVSSPELRFYLGSLLRSKAIKDKVTAALLMAIFFERKPYFLMSRRIMNDLLSTCKEIRRGDLNGTEAAEVFSHLIGNGIFKVLHQGQMQASVWELSQNELAEELLKIVGFEAAKKIKAQCLEVARGWVNKLPAILPAIPSPEYEGDREGEGEREEGEGSAPAPSDSLTSGGNTGGIPTVSPKALPPSTGVMPKAQAAKLTAVGRDPGAAIRGAEELVRLQTLEGYIAVGVVTPDPYELEFITKNAAAQLRYKGTALTEAKAAFLTQTESVFAEAIAAHQSQAANDKLMHALQDAIAAGNLPSPDSMRSHLSAPVFELAVAGCPFDSCLYVARMRAEKRMHAISS